MAIFTIKAVVDIYGTQAQKEHFYKYGKFVNQDTKKALEKTLEQNYEHVEKVKWGKGFAYRLNKKRDKPLKREDKRKENGKKVLYEYQLSSLVLNYLLRNCSNAQLELTLSKLLTEIKLITPVLAFCQFSNGKIKYHLQELQKLHVEFMDKDFVLVKHFIKTDLRRLKQNVGSVLTKLAKEKIINHKKKPMGCDVDDKHRPLTFAEVKQIKLIENNLLIKFGLIKKDLFTDSKNVEKFFEEKEQMLMEQLALKYNYESHCISLKNDVNKTKKRLAKLVNAGELDLEYQLDVNEDNQDKLIAQFKYLFGVSSMELAITRGNKNYESENEHITFRKGDGMYMNLWKKMLKYFDLQSDYFEDDIWDY